MLPVLSLRYRPPSPNWVTTPKTRISSSMCVSLWRSVPMVLVRIFARGDIGSRSVIRSNEGTKRCRLVSWRAPFDVLATSALSRIRLCIREAVRSSASSTSGTSALKVSPSISTTRVNASPPVSTPTIFASTSTQSESLAGESSSRAVTRRAFGSAPWPRTSTTASRMSGKKLLPEVTPLTRTRLPARIW